MLGLNLSLHSRNGRAWWPEGAIFAADFAGQRYMRNGVEIPAAEAFSFSRGSPKWALDATGTWRQFASGVPAITDLGISLEPAGINLVPNPAFAGAQPGILGSGGSLPAGWTLGSSGLSTEIVAITTLLGLPALHLRVSGTASGVFYEMGMMVDTAVAPSSPHAASIVMAATGSFVPSVEVRQATSGSAFVTANVLMGTLGATPVRLAAMFNTQVTTTFSRVRLTRILELGQIIDFEVIVAMPQLEAGAKITSPVAMSRAGDALTLTLPGTTQNLIAEYDDGSTSTIAGVAGSYPLSTSLPRPILRRTWTIVA